MHSYDTQDTMAIGQQQSKPSDRLFSKLNKATSVYHTAGKSKHRCCHI